MNKFKLTALVATIFAFSGCVEQPKFYQTQLSDEARGITVAASTPYNCIVLGEIEGASKTTLGALGANLQTLRDSAIRDAKNNAVYVVGANKRVMLKILNEEAICVHNNKVHNCTDKEVGFIRSYRINAQIFECGTK